MPNPTATFNTTEGSFVVSAMRNLLMYLARLFLRDLGRSELLTPLFHGVHNSLFFPLRRKAAFTTTFYSRLFARSQAELYLDQMPVTCSSFIALANEGYYNGLTFHRVIQK